MFETPPSSLLPDGNSPFITVTPLNPRIFTDDVAPGRARVSFVISVAYPPVNVYRKVWNITMFYGNSTINGNFQ